jgi:hypothetical protein
MQGAMGSQKKGLRGNCGFWRKLAAACRGMTRHAGMGQHKRNIIRKIWTRDKLNKEPGKYRHFGRDS